MKTGSTLWLAILTALIAITATAKPPNIVVFISDDLGRLDTSIHGSKDAHAASGKARGVRHDL
jgi:hypothetical protein